MQHIGHSLGIIADDLTGACDTALQFLNAGLQTTVLLDPTKPVAKDMLQQENTIWVVNTDSRHLDEYDAIASVKKYTNLLLAQYGVEYIYKKIDSTCRGLIAHECLAVLDELRWQACVIAPAYPEQDRKTIGGYQIVNGLPLELTDAARDPLFPVKQSYLPQLLADQTSERIVGMIPLSTIVHGAGPIKKALLQLINEEKKKLIVADACSDTDLEQLALALNAMPSDQKVLPCGSAGLAKALTKKINHPALENNKHADDEETTPESSLEITQHPILCLIGSLHSTSRKQIDFLLSHAKDYDLAGSIHHLQLTPSQILRQTPVFPLIEQALAKLNAGQNVLITTSYPIELIENTQLEAEKIGLDSLQLGQAINRLMSEMALQLLTDCESHLILSGGETANAVCKALGVKTLKLIQELETSITLSLDQFERYIVTKSGGFGERSSLLNIIKLLETYSGY